MAIPIGMNRISRGVIAKASLVFALFHIVMLLGGYYIGKILSVFVDKLGAYSDSSTLMMSNCASIVGALVLGGLGILMLKEGMSGEVEADVDKKNPLAGWALMVLAFSVSVDAMAAGFSFGMMDVNLFKLNIILGSVIFMISWIGLSIGCQAGKFIGERSELLGGIALIVLSGNILWNLV